jgi:Flp pilus assembly protein TadD
MQRSFLKICLAAGFDFALAACADEIDHGPDPDSAGANMTRLAQQLIAQGDKAGAVDFYQRALQRDPTNRTALLEYGALLEQAGNTDAAAQLYSHGLDAKPRDPELLRRYGRTLIALDKPKEAKDQYEKALDVDDDDVKALNGLGAAWDYLGDHEKAQKYFLKALTQDKDDLRTLNNLAYSYILSGHYQEAIARLEPYQKDPAATAALRQNLALAYGLAGMDLDAARIAKMDLNAAQVKANLSYYRRQRAALAVSTAPYLDLGSYATQGMAEAVIGRLEGLDLPAGLTPVVMPEVTVPGGTPRFMLHLTGPLRDEESGTICRNIKTRDIPCVVKMPK